MLTTEIDLKLFWHGYWEEGDPSGSPTLSLLLLLLIYVHQINVLSMWSPLGTPRGCPMACRAVVSRGVAFTVGGKFNL